MLDLKVVLFDLVLIPMISFSSHWLPKIVFLQCLLYIVLSIQCLLLLFSLNTLFLLNLYPNLIRCQSLKSLLLWWRVILLFLIFLSFKIHAFPNVVNKVLEFLVIFVSFFLRLNHLNISNILPSFFLIFQLVLIDLHFAFLDVLLRNLSFLLFLLLFLFLLALVLFLLFLLFL